MNQRNLQITKISDEELTKIQRDLRFINLLSKSAKDKNMRVIVHGGYAVDGFFEVITRAHNDIDLGVWGKDEDAYKVLNELIDEVGKYDSEFGGCIVEDQGRHEWTYQIKVRKGNFLAEIYYAHVLTDPFDEQITIVKKDGSSDNQTHHTQIVKLEGVTFEATSPLLAIVDRLYKQQRGDGVKQHHLQDIANLRLITDKDQVTKRLETYPNG